MTDYAEAHPRYRAAGWHSPLPLPAGAKWPPPEGYTGWHGLDPSGADCHAWTEEGAYAGTGQLALRMPDDIIGIDVDHYGIKRGADTIAEAERRWGPLPLAPYTSARGEGASGIRLFGVPAGVHLRTVLRFAELGLGHVEIIQRHHRYALAEPSVHPDTHDPYLWYGTTGRHAPPRTAAIIAKAQLPLRWLEELRGSDEPGVAEASPEQVQAFARAHLAATRPGALAGVLKIWEDYTGAGMARHDAMTSVACMAAREAVRGYYPAAQAVAALREAFTQEMAHAKAGQRLVAPGAARAEFAGIWAWAVSQALAESDASRAERAQRAERPSTVFSGGGGLGGPDGAGQPSHERAGAADHGNASQGESGGVTAPPDSVPNSVPHNASGASHATSDDEVRAVFPVKDSETLTHSDATPTAPTHSDTPTSAGAPQGMPWDEGEGIDENGLTAEQAAQVEQNMFEAKVAEQLQWRLVNAEAKRREAAMARAGRPSIAEELIDVTELHKVPKPKMIMAKLLPARQVGFIYGPWGTYKSFVATEMVIALAMGRPLFDHPEFATAKAIKSLYVASEGADGIAERVMTSMEQHAREVEGGMLTVYPKPLRLNDPDVIAELALLIEDREYGFVVIDTYHRSAPGVEENSSTEFGVIFEAMAELRDRLGITVLFVDHSGKNGDLRGTSAKTGDGEFLLRMAIEGESRKADVQRTLHAEKHKNAAVGDGWNVRLVELPRVASDDEEDATVAYLELGDVVTTTADGSVFESVKRPDTWFQADIEVPPEVAMLFRSGHGRLAVLDTFRVMVYGRSEAGQTRAEIVAGVVAAEKSGGAKYSRPTIRAAIERLLEASVAELVDPSKPAGRLTLPDRFVR